MYIYIHRHSVISLKRAILLEELFSRVRKVEKKLHTKSGRINFCASKFKYAIGHKSRDKYLLVTFIEKLIYRVDCGFLYVYAELKI